MTTIIKLKYTEFIGHSDANITGKTCSEVPSPEKELLININSNIGLVVDYIREVVQLEPSVEFDFWEESTNQLKNINNHKSHEWGIDLFQPNDTYFLVAIERNSTGQIVDYVPLISGKRGLTEMLGKLRRLTRKVSSSKSQDKMGRKRSQGKSK